MRKADQSPHPIGHVQDLQVDAAVLCGDVLDLGTGRRYGRSRRELQRDLAFALAVLHEGGGKYDDRLAALRPLGAFHEIELSADSTLLPVPDGVRRHFAI